MEILRFAQNDEISRASPPAADKIRLRQMKSGSVFAEALPDVALLRIAPPHRRRTYGRIYEADESELVGPFLFGLMVVRFRLCLACFNTCAFARAKNLITTQKKDNPPKKQRKNPQFS